MEKVQIAEQNQKKWDSRAKTYDAKRFDYFRFMQKKLISLLDLREGTDLLDLGCGTGWAVRYAAAKANQQGEFDGIDISAKMIEIARANSAGCRNVHFFQTGAERLPFNNNYFDCVICSNSFHHYFSPAKVLKEVKRVLKPNEKIFILDLTCDGRLPKMLNRRCQRREPAHVSFYSTDEYRSLFSSEGLNYVGGKIIAGRLIGFPMKVHIGLKNGK